MGVNNRGAKRAQAEALKNAGMEKVNNQWQNTAQTVQQQQAAADAAERAKYNQLSSDARRSRQRDWREGINEGQKLFNNLGRMNEGRSSEIQSIIQRRQKEAEGFTPEEMNAMRDQNLSSAMSGQQAALRQQKIAMAQGGVRGGAAAAALARMQKENTSQNTGMERDLFLKNIDARRAGLGALEQSTQAAMQNEQAMKQFNIQQAMKEKMGQLTTALGTSALGSAERNSILNKLLGEKQLTTQEKIAKEDENK